MARSIPSADAFLRRAEVEYISTHLLVLRPNGPNKTCRGNRLPRTRRFFPLCHRLHPTQVVVALCVSGRCSLVRVPGDRWSLSAKSRSPKVFAQRNAAIPLFELVFPSKARLEGPSVLRRGSSEIIFWASILGPKSVAAVAGCRPRP